LFLVKIIFALILCNGAEYNKSINEGGSKMKKVVLFVVLAMFVAVPVFAGGGFSFPTVKIGSSMVLPANTTLAGFASIGSQTSVSASGPMVLTPLGGSTVGAGDTQVITNPTSIKETDNSAAVTSAIGVAGIMAVTGGVIAQAPDITMTATAGANSGGNASASGTVISYSVAGTNTGAAMAPIQSGMSFPVFFGF
jgi:hypothetical protein